MVEEFYAHTPPKPGGNWHRLDTHLEEVAKQARVFAGNTIIRDLAYWAGLLHDLGKYRMEFQSYLRACYVGQKPPKSPHAIWGAANCFWLFHVLQQHPERWKDLALIIAGHHAGLDEPGRLGIQLTALVNEESATLRALATHLEALPKQNYPFPDLPPILTSETARDLAIRLAFSAVVDADYLDTETHFSGIKSAAREGWPAIQDLWAKAKGLEEKVHKERTVGGASLSPINQVRREIYEFCDRAAAGPQGVYRLTAPTGGGKTRAGLAFALRHCVERGLQRVVVAIPYTSIIDQNIQVYRDLLGTDAVLEHHSQVAVADDEREDPAKLRLQLAMENWAAPVIVTTTVQLFDSLFANHPSRVRKLHHLVDSVIVLDEVQTLPSELLLPTLDVLRELVTHYRVTLVLSTATQPALEEIATFREIGGAEIIPEVDYLRHFDVLQRARPVSYTLRPDAIDATELVDELRRRHQVMVVLNRRKDALGVLQSFGEAPSVFHLSSLLCTAHRRRILETIRGRLKAGEPVHLICTQVVEAGVDISFPAVWRAMGPFDRLIQVAGRCNRNGEFPSGEVVIFELAGGGLPPGSYKQATAITRDLLLEQGAAGLSDPQLCRVYFSRLFSYLRESLDARRVQPLRAELRYRDVAHTYHLIGGDTIPIVVPYGDAMALLDIWRRHPTQRTWRKLQPYVVSLFQHEVTRFGAGHLVAVDKDSDLHYCIRKEEYDDLIGLGRLFNDPSDPIYVV